MVEVTLQIVHKNVFDAGKNLKSELGLILELTNHSNKNVALSISNTNFKKELRFYRRSKEGVYELVLHPYIIQQESLAKAQETSIKNYRSMSLFVDDYNAETSQSLDFFKYWDTFDQDQFSRRMSDEVTAPEKEHFVENVSHSQNPIIFCFLRSGDRQTVFWNLEFMINEKGDYKVSFEPFQFVIKHAPLFIKENFEVVNHQFIQSNDLYIKTY